MWLVLWANKYECTLDQELAERCCIGAGRRLVFTYQVAALFCVKLLHGRHLDTIMPNRKSDYVSWWVFTCQIKFSFRSDLKRRSLRLFLKRSPQQEQSIIIRWVAMRDQFLILYFDWLFIVNNSIVYYIRWMQAGASRRGDDSDRVFRNAASQIHWLSMSAMHRRSVTAKNLS